MKQINQKLWLGEQECQVYYIDADINKSKKSV